MVEKKAFSIREAAESTGISKAMLYLLVARGELRTVRVGRKVLVTGRELDRFLRSDHGGRTVKHKPAHE